MNKKDFVVECSMRILQGQFSCADRMRDVSKAVDHAEMLWEELIKREYVKEKAELPKLDAYL
jgi:DNA-binding protein